MDLAKPQLILSFGSRVNAEQAIVRGKLFKEKRLKIVWAPMVQVDAKMQSTLANNREKLLKTSNELNKLVHLTEVDNGECGTGKEADGAELMTTINVNVDAGKGVEELGIENGSGAVPVLSPMYADTVTTDTTIPELRLEDEEEDDESEDRSWRR